MDFFLTLNNKVRITTNAAFINLVSLLYTGIRLITLYKLTLDQA